MLLLKNNFIYIFPNSFLSPFPVWGKYADHPPLNVFFGDFTGQPFVTDDQYRGILGTTAAWGIDERIDNLFDIRGIPKGTHDPTEDAREICARYAAFFIEQNARISNLKIDL